jgi:hypothetical protein
MKKAVVPLMEPFERKVLPASAAAWYIFTSILEVAAA